MRPDKILTIVSLFMLASALAVRYLSAPIPVAEPRYVPIESFPTHIGQWTQKAVLPISNAVRLKLPTAHIVDRMYVDPEGRSIELMLLTATRRDDMHDPARCLPSQGWNVTQQRRIIIGDRAATALTITQDSGAADAYYWVTGYYKPTGHENPIQSLLDRVRGRIISRQQGMSLFVRLTTTENQGAKGALDDFARRIDPVLDQIKLAALRPGEQVDLSNGKWAMKT